MKLLFNKGFLFYAEFNLRLFFKLLFTKKDILLANDLDTLLPNFLISRLFNKKLVFDSHELFSEIPELVERPKVKWFWRSLEKWIIPKLKNCYTVSESIVNHYKNLYNTNFVVIKNYPSASNETVDSYSLPFEFSEKKIIIYQGAVNIDRGLELMLDAMQFVNDAVFMIAGIGDVLEELKLKVTEENLETKVLFLGRRSPDELKMITPKANLGICLEEDVGLSYHYALPNKLFDYIQAQIPVIVSDLPEMRKTVNDYGVGIVLKERTPENLAKLLNEMLKNGEDPWKMELEKASKELIWERESEKLKAIFQNLG